LVAGGLALGTLGAGAAAQRCPESETVTGRALGEAMRATLQARDGSYSVLATNNSLRFQSSVNQRLIEHALAERPSGGTLFIPHDVLWWEFLKVAGLGESEGDRAPIGRRLGYEFHQSIEVTYGPPERIIKTIKHGPAPLLAANVVLEWPDRPDRLRKFSYEDTGSDPRMKATNHQRLAFRFLVFSDMVVLDDIEGISGRPLSGVLGAIFKVIGEGNAVFTRFSIADDGRQVMRAKVAKVVSKTVTVTINPDGSAQNGVPADRPDLTALEARLEQPLEFEYHPYRCGSAPD
jgi:hypothetical protein